MQQSTLFYLCEKLRPAIIRQNTHLRKAVSVQQRVAITLWCMATPCEYRTVAHLFGVARSTVCTIVHDTCLAITNSLLKIYIKRDDVFPFQNTLFLFCLFVNSVFVYKIHQFHMIPMTLFRRNGKALSLLSFPIEESLYTVINGFEHKWGFPECVGAIDGCHVPISAQLMNHTEYYSR